MTRNQIIDLLTVAAAYDQRTVGHADVTAWVLALSDLDFDRARDAIVAHYREETRRVMPADIRQRSKPARQPPPFAELEAPPGTPPNQEYIQARDAMVAKMRQRDRDAMEPDYASASRRP